MPLPIHTSVEGSQGTSPGLRVRLCRQIHRDSWICQPSGSQMLEKALIIPSVIMGKLFRPEKF